MSSETPGRASIDLIDLGKNKIVEPLNAYRIGEGRFGIARFSPSKPYIVTMGLSACKGLSFYREDTRLGLLAHIAVVSEPDKIICGLVNEVGGTLKGVGVNLVMGHHQAMNSDTGFFWDGKWPTIDELIKEIQKYSPSSFKVDTHANHIKGLALNLEDGELREIEGSNGWSWSDQHDTSLNRRLDEL